MIEGLTQDYQLTIPAILKRADQLYGQREIVTRRPDKTFHRYTYADFVSRTKKLAVALKSLGLESGDRVGTLAWNTYQHLEAYFGVPCSGGVLHTLNPRLHEDDLAYIANHAEDKVFMVDQPLLSAFESFREKAETIEHVIVFDYGDEPVPAGMISYEELIEGADEGDFEYPELDERQAGALCYTSGTTGRPKGALYSHRGVVLHSLMSATGNAFSLSDNDVVLPVVPMFHVNAWGLPYTATLAGSKQVLPGQHLDPESLIEDYEQEKVSFTAGVPTVFLAMLQELDKEPGKHDLSALRSMVIGGAAAPKGVIKAYDERHGVNVIHAWGMTEMDPIGSVAHVTPEIKELSEDEQLDYKAKQGYPTPFVEIRVHGDDGPVPWDGETMGELEVRGPSIIKSYFNTEEGEDKFSEGGWFRTGDIVTIDQYGFIKITDRDKDLVKSGGEWISSVELENALMSHPAVSQAAVIAIPHEKWDERPLAAIVLKEGESATADDLKEHLKDEFANWWLPDAYEFVDEIPQTATGKFLKMKLREQFQDYQFVQN
ncbi:MAG: long-chain fatty acid--CoA ligase [Actinobacteria bacterium]|nr:long-chain fatty acid--CoA ligase [Actinomycetota bacterium]